MSSQKRNRINKLRALQDNKCCYCTREMEEELFQHNKLKQELSDKQFLKAYKKWQNNQLRPTIEHVIPRIDGGSGKVENILISCHFCNSSKADMSHEAYSEIVYDITSVTMLIITRNINKNARNATRKIHRTATGARQRLDEMLNNG